MGVCNCSMFCCMLLYVHSSIAIILMGKRELIALLNLSSWCLVVVERLFLAVPRGCLQFVIVVFPDHTHLLFLRYIKCLSISLHYSCFYLFVAFDWSLCNSYTMSCLPVCEDNPRALVSGLSYVQVDKHGITILYPLH